MIAPVLWMIQAPLFVGETTALGSSPTPYVRSYTQLDVAQHASCVLDAAGAITCWGGYNERFIVNDSPSGSFTSIHVGGSQSACALDALGQATCWGDTTNGLLVPNPVGTFVDIMPGALNWCAV